VVCLSESARVHRRTRARRTHSACLTPSSWRALGRLPRRLDVYAIEGASFTAGDRLSPAVARAVDELATTLGSERR
jgi:hypothetical protein